MQNQWIIDSGATCHMCNQKDLFTELEQLKTQLNVILGDGHIPPARGHGKVSLTMSFPQGKTQVCILRNVLFVPDLAYNLLSVISASKVTTFCESKCEIRDSRSKLIATGQRAGSLYYLLHKENADYQASTTQNSSREAIWHRRFGHLSSSGLNALSKNQMAQGLKFDHKLDLGFCEPCVHGKNHRQPFPQSSGRKTSQPLELVHSDVCGKIGSKSLSGGEYFVTFVDDYTHHVWVYIMKSKCEVFGLFIDWKTLVENVSGRKVKTLRTDNGGEYTSREFELYLMREGINHETTIPHTPEQNGVAERQNRTLIEGVRTLLFDSKLPHRFWAEALSTCVCVSPQPDSHKGTSRDDSS